MDETVPQTKLPVVLDFVARHRQNRPLILMVDDDQGSIRVLLEALCAEYEIAIAPDGATALELLQGQVCPDLILLDIMIPGMDGYEVCQKIKRNAATQHIPVIFITAVIDAAKESLGFEAGAVDYIQKPFQVPLVRERVRKHITIQGMTDKLFEINARLKETIVDLEKANVLLDRRDQDTRSPRGSPGVSASVFLSSAEGIIVTDAAGVIRAVNPAFVRITGYAEAEVLGQTTRFLKSERCSEGCFRQMWESLRADGHWRGELLNQRKNGEIYPELRTMSVVEGEDGAPSHYVAVFSDVSGLRKSQERIDFLTWHDPLTGLPNRLLYLDHLDLALRYCGRNARFSAAAILDIDGFAQVNDAQGLLAGDIVLQEIAKRVAALLAVDDDLARITADEFAILFSSREQKPDAVKRALSIAEDIRAALADRFVCNTERSLSLTCRVGIAIFSGAADETAIQVLQNAETACNRAKREGGNQVVFFEDAMGLQARERFILEHDLRVAITHDDLQLYLQTQVDGTGKIVGAEALVRWLHPVQGLISPAQFIPVAEESRLIVEIDRWVLDRSTRLIKRLQDRGTRLRISVNISPRHFHEPEFETEIAELLQQSGVDPTLLTFEVTERLMISDIDEVIAKMKAISRHGVRFSIDDFGSGYSSLAYLRRLPIHELKIDQAFMLDAPDNPNDALIIEMIYGIANLLGIDTVAEGVETAVHVQLLSKYPKLVQQGYYYGKPKPVEVWLDDNLEHLA